MSADRSPTTTARPAGATDTTIPGLGVAPPPPTTTTTIPPTLEAMVPDLERDIEIVYVDGNTTRTATWRRDQQVNGPPRTIATAAVTADFDAAGSSLLLATHGALRDALWVGSVWRAEPVWVDITSAAWHPQRAGTLAWIGRLGTQDEYRLMTGTTVDGATGGLATLTDFGPLRTRSTVAGWGDWGFVLGVEAPAVVADDGGRRHLLTVVLDAEGRQVAAHPGWPWRASVDGHVIVDSADEAFDAAVAAGFDPADIGVTVPVTPLTNDAPDGTILLVDPAGAVHDPGLYPRSSSHTLFAFTADGTVVSMIDRVVGRMAVESVSLDGSVRRLTSVEGAERYVGHSNDGRYVLLANSNDGRIALHDWDRGSTFEIPFDEGVVIAVNS
jgi:hypothetical protein